MVTIASGCQDCRESGHFKRSFIGRDVLNRIYSNKRRLLQMAAVFIPAIFSAFGAMLFYSDAHRTTSTQITLIMLSGGLLLGAACLLPIRSQKWRVGLVILVIYLVVQTTFSIIALLYVACLYGQDCL